MQLGGRFPALNTSTGFLKGIRVSHVITRRTETAKSKNVKHRGKTTDVLPPKVTLSLMNDRELAIACVLYVAKQEQITPLEVLWGLVPIANRQIVCDGCQHEKEPEQAA